MQHSVGFQYSVKPIRGGWIWEAWERDSGRRSAGGVAATRSEAAAYLTRHIARSMTEPAVPEAAGSPAVFAAARP